MSLSDLVYLLPELVLLTTAVLVFAVDLLAPRGAAEPSTGRRFAQWPPYLALGGLVLALVATVPNLGEVRQVAGVLAVDPFGSFFKALAIMAVTLVMLMAIPYMATRSTFKGEFYALLVVVALAICLAVSATNLVMLYLSFEFLSITSYILAGYLRNDHRSGEAAIKYFLYGATASTVMLYGMSLLYGATGTTDLGQLAIVLSSRAPGELAWLTTPAVILLMAGFGFKASLVPFHQWVPDTYEGAPTPVTALLSTASKATGFAVLMRVFLVALGQPSVQIQWSGLLVAVSILTMTVGNLTALRQSNIKRMLAYSSIAQAGYILMGVAAFKLDGSTFTGINGVLVYLFAYLFTNAGAFAVVTAFENATGKTELKDYSGMVRRSPWLAGLLFLFLVSLAGIPPTGGFLAKFFVFGAVVQRQMWALAAVAAVNSVVAAFYYLNVVRYMFFVPAEEDAAPVAVALPLRGALLIAGLLTALLGLAPGPLIAWVGQSSLRLLALP